MIRLTGTNGTAIYINPDKIISFNEDDGETFIDYGYDRYIVTEPATEVARKVLEWRLAMERLRAAMVTELVTDKKEIALSEYQNIKRLSGLEDAEA